MLTNNQHHVSVSDAATLTVAPPRRRLSELWESLWGPTARKGALGLTDQVVASSARFATTVLVGRCCGADQLGVYSLGFTLVIFFVCLQESLITTPYTILVNRWAGKRQTDYAGGSLLQFMALSMLAVIVLATIGVFASAGIGLLQVAPVIWVLAGIIPLMLLREFARRFAFAHLKMTLALAIDATVAVIQIGALLWLAVNDALTAGRAFMVVGLACGAATILWLALAKKHFTWNRRTQWPAAQRNWRMGKWIFAGQITGALTTYSLFWILSLLLDTSATGLFAACMTLVLLANPFIFGIGNVLSPLAAKAVAKGDHAKVRHLIGKAVLLVALAMTLFCGLLSFLGDLFVTTLYGNQFSGNIFTIAVLAMGALAAAISVAVDSGLYAIQRADVAFRAGLAGLLVTLALAVPLVLAWGVFGAALSFLCGNTVLSTWQTIAFFRLTATTAGGESQ